VTGQLLRFPSPHEPWMTTKQLAAHFGMSERWVRDRRREGMPSVLWGNRRRYRISACEGWLMSRAEEQRRAS